MTGLGFTVIIVSYASGPHLAELLPTLAPAEVVIVDNGPAEQPLGEVQAPGVRVVGRGQNLGFGAGVNLAVSSIDTPVFLIVNPDARPSFDDLSTLAAVVSSESQVAQIGAMLTRAPGKPQGGGAGWQPSLSRVLSEVAGVSRLGRESGLYEKIRRGEPDIDVDWVAGTCVAIKTKAFRSVGGFDERWFLYFEDWDLGHRLAEEGWQSRLTAGVSVRHARGTSAGAASSAQRRQAAEAQNEYFRYRLGPLRGRLAQFMLAVGFAGRSVAHLLSGRRSTASENLTHLRATLAGNHGLFRAG